MSITITDVEGNKVIIAESALEAERIVLRFGNGRVVDVETSLLLRESPTDYRLPFMVAEDYGHTARESAQGEQRSADVSADTQVIRLAEELLHVEKVERPSETVRISKSVVEDIVTIQETLRHEDINVERKPVATYVSERTPVRQDGDTIIIPVYEEVVVVERRWLLREEIHVTKQQSTRPFQEDVVVRREQIEVKRISPQDSETALGE